MLPRWFTLALEARIQREHLYLLLDADKLNTPEFHQHRVESTRLAHEAGYENPMIPMPALLGGDDELEEAFKDGQSDWHQEKQDELESQLTAKRNAEIEQKIAAKDWAALGLPLSHALLADLRNGEQCDVEGHTLSPDEDGVWVTNPYGIDCGLWQEIDLEFIENFLADMARGEEYGPVPH